MLRKFISTVIVACLAGCTSTPSGQALDLRSVVSDSAAYDGQNISVVACINVTVHGVTLLPCGERSPNVDIEASVVGDPAYARLVSYAHSNMGHVPEDLPVLVVGRLMATNSNGKAHYSITVEEFQRRQVK